MKELDEECSMKYHSIDDVLTFGKYKDKTVGWVYENDPAYIVWVNKNVPNFKIKNIIVAYCRLDVFESSP